MKKIYILLLLLTTASLFAATWTGASSEYWNHPSNWSPASVPTSATDVVIPGTGITNWPLVSGVSANCRNLTINSGGRISIYNQPLTVAQNFTNNGLLDMQVASAWLVVQGDAIWNNGSTLTTGGFCTFDYYGDLTLESGSSMVMTAGFLRFKGTPLASFTNRSAATQIWHFYNEKTYTASDLNSGRLFVANDPASQPFTIAGNLQNGSTAKTFIDWTGNITLKGNLTTLADYDYYIDSFDCGTLIMDGANQTININDECYLNNLTASQTGILTLDSGLYLTGDMSIQSGVLAAGGQHIILLGNWINTAGPDAFNEGTSTVEFNHVSAHQYCNYSENFNELIVRKVSGGALRVNNSAAVVTCAQYDWGAGAIDVLAGSFTALDLVDNGVVGKYYVNPGATINLTNTDGLVDLDGLVNFNGGGTINVYGGTAWSTWKNVTLNMNGGTFAFHDQGVNISGSSSYTFSASITGGTIKVGGNFQCDRPIAPSGSSIFEFIGTNANSLYMVAGTLHNVIVNKGGTGYVYLVNSLTTTGNITVQSSKLSLGDEILNCAGSLSIYGTLTMPNAAATLNVSGSVTWYNGSLAEISLGTINGSGSWIMYAGSIVQIPSVVTVNLNATTSALSIVSDVAANYLGTVFINGTGSVYTLDSENLADLHIAGNLTITAGNELDLGTGFHGLILDGTLHLYGTLDIHANTATLHGKPYLYAGSILNIDSGTFFCDESAVIPRTTYLNGTLSINTGNFNLVNNTITANAGSVNTMASGTIYCDGFQATNAGTFQPAGGSIYLTARLAGGTYTMSVSNGNWLPAVYIQSTYRLGADLTVKGSMTIESGGFFDVMDSSSNVYKVTVSGNWSNQGGTFYPRTGRVVFNGSGHQYVNYSETFNIVEANKSGGAIRVDNTDAVVTISQYDWTAGSVDVLTGTLTINDLADNGMYGGYYCTPGGTLNIVQDAAQTLNLYGIIQLTGGAVNISGGSGADANWARYSACTVNVGGGSLNYLDKGIQIRNTYAFTNSITGGTISTAGSIYCNRTDFVPAGGTFEMTGATNVNLDFQSAPGSSLYNLRISKANLSARVTQTASVQTIRGDLTIDNGTYYMLNRTLNCLGFLRIFTDAMLSCQGLSTVKMGAAKAIYVNSGGYIDAVGTNNDTRVTFTRYNDGSYTFNVEAGGTLTANYIVFEYLGNSGLYINEGGSIGGLHNCTFQHGTPGAPLLYIRNTQDIVITHASFPTNAGSNPYNVFKTFAAGSVTLSDYTGAFSGEDFEYDPNDRVYWTGPDVNLQLVQVHWLRPDGYVCAPLQATFMVVNGGTHDIVTPIRIDLYKNLPTAPPAGTLGDLYQEIAALSSGTAVYVTFNDVSTDIAGSWTPWARVDANQIIPETNENDNLLSSLPVTYWEALPEVTGLTMTRIGFAGLRLDWDYPISVNRFNVYRSEDPYFTPVPGSAWANVTTDYINTVFNNEMWFYTVKAERDLP